MLENGERYENLSWRLWARHLPKIRISEPIAQIDVLGIKTSGFNAVPTPLSEPELSTDESVSSEDEDVYKAEKNTMIPQPNNAFDILTRSGCSQTEEGTELERLAHDVNCCWSSSCLSHSHDLSYCTQLSDGEETIQETESRGTGTPISTTGTITPHIRSRANSTCLSPLSQNFGSKLNEAHDTISSQNNRANALTSGKLFDGGKRISSRGMPSANDPIQERSVNNNASQREKNSSSAAKLQQLAQPQLRSRRQRSLKSMDNIPGLRQSKSAIAKAGCANIFTSNTNIDVKSEKPKKKGKIVFMVGGDSEEDEVPQDDDDAWSSEEEDDTSLAKTSSEAELARKAEEEEREREDMFKKRPLRSVSLADLPHATSSMVPPLEATATRGLLSTILKPSDPDSKLSAPTHTLANETIHFASADQNDMDASVGHTSMPSCMPRAPSYQSICLGNSSKNTMNRSKSVLALPLLNLTSLHSCTSSGRPTSSTTTANMSESSGAMTKQGNGEAGATSGPQRAKSNLALTRLSAIAQRGSSETDQKKFSSLVRSYSAIGNLMTPITRSESPQCMSTADEENDDGLSLGVRADDHQAPRVKRVPQPFIESGPMDETSSPKRLSRVLPQVANKPLQQALLHDELSQSVRDNLIWQRESRERMLGLQNRCMKTKPESSTGATAHPQRRSASVVHLEHFRPHDDEGSFHHKGW